MSSFPTTSSPSPSPPPPPPADSQIDHAVSLSYWSSISPDVNGMLGGYPQVSRIDLQGSRTFIAKVRRQLAKSKPVTTTTPTTSQPAAAPKLPLAADCGAGIGRITTSLLSTLYTTTDIVEPIAKFANSLSANPQVGTIYITGLESWHPAPSKQYDLIWAQWCVGHLTDSQLVSFLRRAGQALSEDGWVCVKENLSGVFREAADLYDELDSSVTRSDGKFLALFEEAGLTVLRMEVQSGFPKGLGLFPVKMYALRPKDDRDSE